MVLVSFVLVVVAAIALVIGLLQSGLGIIYVSIACSVLAGVVLVIAVLRGRPEARPAGAPAARPAPQAAPPPPSAAEDDTTRVSAPPPPPPPQPEPEREPAMAGAGQGGAAVASDRTEQLQQVEIEEAVATDDGFPIHDYEKLRATEILPMLAELDEEQLEAVRRREQGGKNRFMILSRIDDELQAREGEGWDADDEGWVEEEAAGEPPAPEPVPAPVSSTPASEAVLVGPAEDAGFPIPDYDNLRALEILGRLSDLNGAELQAVRRREQSGQRRAMILNRVDRLLEDAAPEPAEPEPTPAAPGRRGRATKAPGTKRAAGAKKTAAAAPRPTKRTAKAPATKARAAKAPAGKAAAGKAPAAKAGRSRAAKAPATKSPAAKKSALPTKKVTKRR